MQTFKLKAKLVDVVKRIVFPAEIIVQEGRVTYIKPAPADECKTYILPGFIDAHVHIESSLMIPSEFARMAVNHGTVATVSDPHEIGNVLGVKGVEFMLQNAAKVPFHFFFGAPSCVPATTFETAGAEINAEEVAQLLARKDIWYLAEVMNFPGVLDDEEEVMKKIKWAWHYNKPIDGHAPGLRGRAVEKYAAAGITTDHECFTIEEARDKIAAGMKIQIREGSAARNFEALHPLLQSNPERVMFCSDDKHPDHLFAGHINLLVKRALELGYDLFDVLRAATLNVRDHYQIPVGMLQLGDPADFIQVDNLVDLNVLRTFIKGECVSTLGVTHINSVEETEVNYFHSYEVALNELKIRQEPNYKLNVIEAIEGQLITNRLLVEPQMVVNGYIESDTHNDILKIAVVNRYEQTVPALGFIKNIGIKNGAFAATVAHDSHNIIAIGCDDFSLQKAINTLMASKGGLCVVSETGTDLLPLPIAGLMTNKDAWEVNEIYTRLDRKVKEELGSPLNAPFMTLSFMALLVIPSMKLSDQGLFDGNLFRFMNLQEI
jgi:adenine deaminase